jgi:hypothetical protein
MQAAIAENRIHPAKAVIGFAMMTLLITPGGVNNQTCSVMRISLTSQPRFPEYRFQNIDKFR